MWEALTAIGTIFTSLVILITAIVGFYQLRQVRAQRQDTAAVQLVRSLQDDALLNAYHVVYSLQEFAPASEIQARGGACIDAADLLGFRFEMLGVLVYRGAVPFDIAEDLVGGLVVGAWRRLGNHMQDVRVARKWPTYMEWFQWLAEQFEKRNRLERAPAHHTFRDWRPAT